MEWDKYVMLANMVNSLEQKPWSSYGVPLVHRVDTSIVTTETNIVKDV